MKDRTRSNGKEDQGEKRRKDAKIRKFQAAAHYYLRLKYVVRIQSYVTFWRSVCNAYVTVGIVRLNPESIIVLYLL